MASVNFTYALKRFFPDLKEVTVSGKTVREVVDQTESLYPGIKNYILDDQGRLREHVNIFLNGELIKDKLKQSDTVGASDEVYIMQALSGG
jgi:molybdopterin converting factor small subunit